MTHDPNLPSKPRFQPVMATLNLPYNDSRPTDLMPKALPPEYRILQLLFERLAQEVLTTLWEVERGYHQPTRADRVNVTRYVDAGSISLLRALQI